MVKKTNANGQQNALASADVVVYVGADKGKALAVAKLATNSTPTAPAWAIVKKLLHRRITVSEVEDDTPVDSGEVQFYSKEISVLQQDQGSVAGKPISEISAPVTADDIQNPLLAEKFREQQTQVDEVNKNLRQQRWMLWIGSILLGALIVGVLYFLVR